MTSIINATVPGSIKHARFRIGSFNISLSSFIPEVLQHIQSLYSDYEVLADSDFIDFHVQLASPSISRRFFRRQVVFSLDGYIPFKPLPYAQAPAMFEWGMNWCIASHSNYNLIIHAAVVELNNRAFIFPGTPGSGKSTLCAALVCRGWRLLSDEMALISINDGLISPVPRPISLKNQSIPLIQTFSNQAVIGRIVADTAKGTVGHMKPPENSVKLAEKQAKPSFLIFPKYKQVSETKLMPLSKGKAMVRAASDCFNYNVLGAQGFNCLGDFIDHCECYEFEYSSLDEAVSLFTDMAN